MITRTEIIPRRPSRERPCPACGYDLRGTAATADETGLTRRCPECGLKVRGHIGRKSLPWVRRRHIGRVRAFLRTSWILLWRPGTLAEFAHTPLQARSALRFERLATTLATVLGSTSLKLSLFVPTTGRVYFPESSWAWWLLPARALEDSAWGILPMLLAVGLCLRGSMTLYRGIVATGGRSSLERARLARAARYGSAAVAAITVLACILVFLIATLADLSSHNWMRPLVVGLLVLTIIGTLAIYGSACFGLILRTGARRKRRAALLALFPLAVAAYGAVLLMVAHWIAGYIALAIGGMAR